MTEPAPAAPLDRLRAGLPGGKHQPGRKEQMMLLGKHPGPPCEVRCDWKLDATLAAAGHTRHVTCGPEPQAKPAAAEPDAAADLQARLAELDRLVVETRITGLNLARELWPDRFPAPGPEVRAEADVEAGP